ncbi:MAG: ribose 5-phosphate isomerase B [Deltaproteobacteria bacterium]|nr:ribose 5-phosphate isomerase B [Deltaproteobacteria bacterium]
MGPASSGQPGVPPGAGLVVAVGCDHAGRDHKEAVRAHLEAKGHRVLDLGVSPDVDRADYPEVAIRVSRLIQSGQARFGVLVCGTGVGMCMAANRHPGVRAANCNSEFLAVMARAHNDANVLTLGQRAMGPGLALSVLDAFLSARFEGGRHQERIDLFDRLSG